MSDSNEKIWFYAEAGQQVGPFTEDELNALLNSGKITDQVPVWKTGMTEWLPMAQVEELPPAKPPKPAPTKMPLATAPEEEPHLKLGASRTYDSVNQMDSDPDGGLEVTDLLKGEDKKKQEPRIVEQSKVGFFESFGLASFEAAFFAVTLILAGIACAIKQDYWHAIVIGLGALWVFVASWAIVVRAFMRHWGWGVACLLLSPLAQLIYIVVDLKNAYKPLVLMIVGVAAIITPIQSESFKTSPIYDLYEQYEDKILEEIEKQQKELEESRNERLEQFE